MRILLLVLIFCTAPLTGQEEKADSLVSALRESTSTEDSLEILTSLLDDFRLENRDKQQNHAWARQRYRIARATGDEDLIARARFSLGVSYRYTGHSSKSIELLSALEDYFLENDDYPDLERFYQNLSLSYIVSGDIPSALAVRRKQLNALLEQPDVEAAAEGTLLGQIAYLAVYAGEVTEAAELIERSRKIGESLPETSILAASALNLSILYGTESRNQDAINVLRDLVNDDNIVKTQNQAERAEYNLAFYYREEGKLDSSVYYTERILSNLSPEVNIQAYFSTRVNQATLYYQLGSRDKFMEAMDSLRSTTMRFPDYDGKSVLIEYVQLQGLEQIELGNPERGKALLEQGLANAEQEKNPAEYLHHLNIAYLGMAAAGDYRKALKYHVALMKASDELVDQETKGRIAELRTRFESQEKDARLKLQQTAIDQNKSRNRYLYAIVALLALFLFLTIMVLYQRSRMNKLLVEQKHNLELMDEVKSRFFTNITHELRTPLSLILAPLERALEVSKSTTVRKQIELARTNGNRLLSLVNEMLDLSKLESGEMRLEFTHLNIQETLRRIFFSFHSISNVRGIMLSFQYHLPENLWVETDLPKFEKIISNLLSNAIKYSDHGGVVTLKVSPAPIGKMRVEIQDTGRGISEEEREKVFDRFYQVSSKEQPLQGGTGIGLALARELADALGGTLTLTSSVGVGSTFALELPLRKVAAPAKTTAAEANVPVPVNISDSARTRDFAYSSIAFADQRPTVLIVEDNPEMSSFLSDMLGGDYLCAVARNGLEGLEKISQSRFDLVISDLMMPHMDGYAFRGELLKDQRYRDIPFIFLTARSASDDKIRGLRLGVDDYLTKPFNARELMARAANLIENSEKRKEALQETPEPAEPLTADEKLLSEIETYIKEHLDDRNLTVESLAAAMLYSRRQLSRLTKKQTGMSPARLVQEIRMQHAYRCLEQREYRTIAEVALSVGFDDPSYFSKVFGKRFGKQPSQVMAVT